MDYARQSESMAVCGFIQYMIEKTDSNEWIQLQIDVMTQCLECMKKYGIDSVIKFYTRLLEKRKCNQNLEERKCIIAQETNYL